MKLPAFDAPPAAAPISYPSPVGYHVIVEPRKPPAATAGGIVLAQKTRRANRATDYIGTVVAMGQFAFTAKTAEIDWATLKDAPKVGDLVVYKQHAGQKLRLRQQQQELIDGDDEDEAYLLLMYDTDLIAKVTPEQAEQFYSWV